MTFIDKRIMFIITVIINKPSIYPKFNQSNLDLLPILANNFKGCPLREHKKIDVL